MSIIQNLRHAADAMARTADDLHHGAKQAEEMRQISMNLSALSKSVTAADYPVLVVGRTETGKQKSLLSAR